MEGDPLGLPRRAAGGSLFLRDALVPLDPADNVAIARWDLPAGLELAREGQAAPLRVRQPIPAGHKLSLAQIGPGQAVRRYGQTIGFARGTIEAGEWVHVHNVSVQEFGRALAPDLPVPPVKLVPAQDRRTFLGYRRADGRVGTRNYLAILSTVNCSAHAAREIARTFAPERLAGYSHVDGVIALTHSSGCPVDQPLLRRTLAGMVRHPNVGASLLVGLGCETGGVAGILEAEGVEGAAVRTLVIQEQGGLRRTIEAGVAAVEELLPRVDQARRAPAPVSELMVALQCGGSDAWSGVSANPVVGRVADELVRQGGTVVLAETPEVYGAEQLLTRRAISLEVAEKLVGWVRWWGEYARQMGFDLDKNRAPGNEAGGLTTIYEKSLGAVAKAGSTPLMDVVDYAQPVQARGLVFMNSPGFDPVAVTGQMAGGCNLVLFTTGRGSVAGSRPAPCIKISSTSSLYRRMPDDMDLDAGRVLLGEEIEALAAELLDLVIAVASGQPSRSEAQNAGEAEFCPWNREGLL